MPSVVIRPIAVRLILFAALTTVLSGCLGASVSPNDEASGVSATQPFSDSAPPTDTPFVAEIAPRAMSPDRITAEDGLVSEDAPLSPFDADHAAIANLDPDLRSAIQDAAIDAGAAGVDLFVNSGWRSERYQQSLLDEAVVTYGSTEEARKWVNTPERSTHVTGEAIDVGPTDAATWLSLHGSGYGLCQVYANEIWHYELAADSAGNCPEPVADASSGHTSP
jgi:zinc D-Ala-D-Ala carboxypeptidase